MLNHEEHRDDGDNAQQHCGADDRVIEADEVRGDPDAEAIRMNLRRELTGSGAPALSLSSESRFIMFLPNLRRSATPLDLLNIK